MSDYIDDGLEIDQAPHAPWRLAIWLMAIGVGAGVGAYIGYLVAGLGASLGGAALGALFGWAAVTLLPGIVLIVMLVVSGIIGFIIWRGLGGG